MPQDLWLVVAFIVLLTNRSEVFLQLSFASFAICRSWIECLDQISLASALKLFRLLAPAKVRSFRCCRRLRIEVSVVIEDSSVGQLKFGFLKTT